MFVQDIGEAPAETQAAGVDVVETQMFAGGQAHAVALLPCPEVLAVQVKGGGIVDVPDVARAEMQAIVGRTAVVVRLTSGASRKSELSYSLCVLPARPLASA